MLTDWSINYNVTEVEINNFKDNEDNESTKQLKQLYTRFSEYQQIITLLASANNLISISM